MSPTRAWVMVVYAALVGAALHGLAHPPVGFAPGALLAHALPLAVLCRVPRGEQARALGLSFGTLAYALPLRWLGAVFGGASFALFLVFGILHVLVFQLLFAVRERHGSAVMLGAAPIVLVGLECFRSEWWFLRFPWATPGLAQIHDIHVRESAELFGVYGLSLVAYALSAALAGAAVLPRHRLPCAVLAIAAFAVPALLGAWRGALAAEDLGAGPPLTVAVVQYETNDIRDALRLAEDIDDDVELAVFPELGAALLDGVAMHRDAPPMREQLGALARAARATVAIGVTERAGDDFYNTLLVVDEDGRALAAYHKAEPVPLFADGLRSGPSPPIATPLGRLGLAICYDFTHPHVVLAALEGAELWVVASGDLASWSALQHEEHRLIARFRAIEHRRWIVRATSSGVSHVIDPRGAELTTIGFEETGVRTAVVRRRAGGTLASTLGMTIPYGCLLITALAGVALAVASLRRREA